MKKIILMAGLFTLSLSSFSQSPLWWKLDGSNTGNSTTALGISNSESLRFKANDIVWLSISPTGEYFFHSLADATSGLMGVKQDGKVSRINFTGDDKDVFRGDGTFGPISNLTGWTYNGTFIYTLDNVGIGTNIAPEKLSVNGNILANGSISGTSLNVVDIVTSGKEFKIATSIHMTGKDAADPNSKNEICGLNGDLFIQCENNNNYNTVLNYGSNGKVGVGIIPTEDFHVGVQARFDENIYTDKIYTNRITSEDSVIYLGDSSILIDHTHNRVNWSNTSIQDPLNPNVYLPIRGLTIGRGNSLATGLNSIAIGNNIGVSGGNSITIGSGFGLLSANKLNNNVTNSLMIGFNSNLPTMTVLPATGVNTIGQVGIGTTCVPTGYTLAIKGKVMMEEGTVKLADANGCWPDFVFEDSYQKMSWENKLEFIQENKHLPYMPSVKEIEANGLEIGAGMAAITQNVEENTLDILDLFIEMEKMKTEMEKLKRENQELKEKLK